MTASAILHRIYVVNVCVCRYTFICLLLDMQKKIDGSAARPLQMIECTLYLPAQLHTEWECSLHSMRFSFFSLFFPLNYRDAPAAMPDSNAKQAKLCRIQTTNNLSKFIHFLLRDSVSASVCTVHMQNDTRSSSS